MKQAAVGRLAAKAEKKGEAWCKFCGWSLLGSDLDRPEPPRYKLVDGSEVGPRPDALRIAQECNRCREWQHADIPDFPENPVIVKYQAWLKEHGKLTWEERLPEAVYNRLHGIEKPGSDTEAPAITACPECEKEFTEAIWVDRNKLGTMIIKDLKSNQVLHQHLSQKQIDAMKAGRARKRASAPAQE